MIKIFCKFLFLERTVLHFIPFYFGVIFVWNKIFC